MRCFEDDDIIHVDGSVDPARDMDVISLELVLADLEQVEKRQFKAARDKKTSPEELRALEAVAAALNGGRPARSVDLTPEEEKTIKGLMLLSRKPVLRLAVRLRAQRTWFTLLANVTQRARAERAPPADACCALAALKKRAGCAADAAPSGEQGARPSFTSARDLLWGWGAWLVPPNLGLR